MYIKSKKKKFLSEFGTIRNYFTRLNKSHNQDKLFPYDIILIMTQVLLFRSFIVIKN